MDCDPRRAESILTHFLQDYIGGYLPEWSNPCADAKPHNESHSSIDQQHTMGLGANKKILSRDLNADGPR